MVVFRSLAFAALLLQARAEVQPAPGMVLSGEVGSGERALHTLSIPAGSLLRLRVAAQDADVNVCLRDPRGRALVETDTLVFPPGSVTFGVVSRDGGVHRLELWPGPATRFARYAVTVLDARMAEEGDLLRLEAEEAYRAGERGRLRGTAESQRVGLERFEQALALARRLDDRALEADALTGSGRIRDARGDKPAALRAFDEALRIDLELGRPAAVVYLLNFKYLVLEQTGDRQAARDALEQALATAREARDRRAEGISLGNLGMLHYETGERDRALALHQQALAVHREAGNPRGEAVSLANIGTLYDAVGDKARALEFLHQSLAIRRALGDPRELAPNLNNIGAVHFSLDEMSAAVDSYRQALEQWRLAEDPSGEGATLHNIARVHEAVGESQEAIRLWRQALALFRAANARVREANVLTRLGQLYARLGDGRRALVLYEEALQAHRATGNRAFEADTLSQMGALYAARGDQRRALELLAQALDTHRAVRDPRGQAAALLRMGLARLTLGETEEARRLHGEALVLYRELRNRRGEAETLASLAELELAKGDAEAARAAAEHAASLARALNSPRHEAAALKALARLARAMGDLETAWRRAEESIALVESLRSRIAGGELRAAFLASVQDHYELLTDVLVRLHRARPGAGFDALALQASERARARSLLESLSEARGGIREGLDETLLRRERALQQALNAKAARQARLLAMRTPDEAEAARTDRELDALAAEWQALQAEIRATSPRYAALTQPAPLDLGALQERVLDPGTLLLEYSLGSERSFLFAVSSDALEVHELPPRAAVEEAARRFSDEVRSAAPPDGASPAARELGRVLLGPAVGRIVAARRLLFVADGALHAVPLAALPAPGDAEGRPLVTSHAIVSLPSASILDVIRSETAGRPLAPRALAVLADPVFDAQDPRVRARGRAASLPGPLAASRGSDAGGEALRGDFARLIGSRREAAAILALVPPAAARGALDFEASRATALDPELGRYRMVHLATHGLLDGERPELSGVVLSLVDAKGREQDGFLRLHDVYNLRWPAELVVLSACQTGLGQEVRGEGLIGLTRGFMYAGARRVVTTLWKVDDRATAFLMGRFYRAMLAERLTPAAALRLAQQETRAQPRWEAPFYWAGFVLQGEWR